MTTRKFCIGGCGRLVLIELGAECRKCKRKRKYAELKRIKKAEKSKNE